MDSSSAVAKTKARAAPTHVTAAAPATVHGLHSTTASQSGVHTRATRPKSAGASTRRLLLGNHHDDRSKASSPSARAFQATFSSSRVGLEHSDQFCTKFRSLRQIGPRPPSAASALASTSNSSNNSSGRLPQFRTTNALDLRRVLKEEIETQRLATRQAQRQFHALQLTLAQKTKELELVRRHVSTFAMRSSAMETAAVAAGVATSPVALSSSPPLRSSSVVAVLSAGAQSGGIGARHRESIAAAVSRSDSHAPLSSASSTAARLRDHAQRQDLYKKKLRHVLERLERHVQFIGANVVALQRQHASAQREQSFFEAKVGQARNQCTALEHARQALVAQQATHALTAQRVLDSLRDEIASRTVMNRQREGADQRRDELLALVQSRPSARSSTQSVSANRHSSTSSANGAASSRKSSCHVLFTDTPPLMARRSASSPPARSNRNASVDLQQFVQCETFVHIYEAQYARVLAETRESDLSVVLARFVGYDATVRQLRQIETDASQQHVQLERERAAHDDLVRKLRVSGMAEVEKRKRIRDFLEQLHDAKAQSKSAAKDKCIDQLKTFSLVQQGIGNIVELLKCINDRIALPSTARIASPLAPASSPAAVAHALGDVVRYCVQVARSSPASAPIVFTVRQVETLRQFVVDSAVGSAAWAHPSRPSNLSHGQQPAATSNSSSTDDTAVAVDAESLVQSLPSDKRRQSSTASALGWESTLSQPRSGSTAAPTAADDCDSDEQLSSESDTENARHDIKRSERDTLQQVEALLKTIDARQSIARSETRPTGAALRHRSSAAGRRGSLSLVSVLEDNSSSSNNAVARRELTSLPSNDAADRVARLEAVHAFFREKRRRERQEQQQQREMLALLADAAHSTRTYSSSSSCSAESGNSVRARQQLPSTATATNSTRAPFAPTTARKRSNGVVSLALHSVAQPSDDVSSTHQQQQSSGARRPKTVR